MDKQQILEVAQKYYKLGFKMLKKYHNVKLEAPYYTKFDYLNDLYLYLYNNKHFQRFDSKKMSLYRYMHTFIFPNLNNKLAAKTENYIYKGSEMCKKVEWKTIQFCPIDNEDVSEQLVYKPSNKMELDKINKRVMLYATNLALKKSQKIGNEVKAQLIDLKEFCEEKRDIEDINKYITKNTKQQLNRVAKRCNIKMEDLKLIDIV